MLFCFYCWIWIQLRGISSVSGQHKAGSSFQIKYFSLWRISPMQWWVQYNMYQISKWKLTNRWIATFLYHPSTTQCLRPIPSNPSFVPTLTLEGIRVAGDEVLQLIAVGVNVVEGFSFYSKLVAFLHLPGAAGRTLVLTNQQIHI